MGKITQGLYPGVFSGILILILTSLPGSFFSHSGMPSLPGMDKVVHFAMFALFGFASLWGYREKLAGFDNRRLIKTALIMVAIGVVYGGMTEAMQHFLIDGRSGSPYDLIADVAGTVIGTIIYIATQKNREKKMQNSGSVKK